MNREEGCCSGDIRNTIITRVVFESSEQKTHTHVVRRKTPLSKNFIDFKATSLVNGSSRRMASERSSEEYSVKASTGGRVGHTLLSLAIPGDSDPIRSPVRSAVYRTLTPGFGVGGGSSRRKGKPYRCPEGYQYGGRFTDSRLSTCGVKLFDIPSPLGMLISALAKKFRTRAADPITGNPITGGEYPDSLIESRKPQIPKVSKDNSRLADVRIKEMKQSIATHPAKTARMVRRDGFLLEPVVSAKVLREIPDNRDMEGATYILSAFGPQDIGNDELGMLSNSGVRSVVYVTPSGSSLTIEKARQLTVGERRKLGKTVTISMAQNNSKDPSARLKYLANEMGDGISYSEEFVNIKNPNEIKNNKPRWASEVFNKKNITKPIGEDGTLSRETVSSAAMSKKISSLAEAIEFVNNGGSLARIDPKILQRVLAKTNFVKKEKISQSQNLLTISNGKYFEYTNPKQFQHIGERFASDLQEHLGLPSPDVIFSGPQGDKRRYMRQDVETAMPGSVFNPNVKLYDLDPKDVAKMMISDFLTDQRERDLSSVYGMQTVDGVVPMLAQNTTSGLTDLSKIEIAKRTKMNILEFYKEIGKINYSDYYKELKIEQQIIFKKVVESMLKRARSFKVNDLRSRMALDGLSAGELAHIKIIDRLFEIRVESLSSQKKKLVELLGG